MNVLHSIIPECLIYMTYNMNSWGEGLPKYDVSKLGLSKNKHNLLLKSSTIYHIMTFLVTDYLSLISWPNIYVSTQTGIHIWQNVPVTHPTPTHPLQKTFQLSLANKISQNVLKFSLIRLYKEVSCIQHTTVNKCRVFNWFTFEVKRVLSTILTKYLKFTFKKLLFSDFFLWPSIYNI